MSEDVKKNMDIEDWAELQFTENLVQTEGELTSLVKEVFESTCGNFGKEVFLKEVLPKILRIYDRNYRKAGLRLLKIINEAGYYREKYINVYFRSVVSRAEIQFIEQREEIRDIIIESIKEIILNKEIEMGERCGVIGVLIFGSFAEGGFNLMSDLDVRYAITETGEHHLDFEAKLRAKTGEKIPFYRRRGLEIYSFNRFLLDEHEEAPPEEKGDKETYMVISPYPDVEEKIKELMEAGLI